MEPSLIVFDIDGTLADLSHRLHHLDRGDWDSFFAACGGDMPIQPGIDVFSEFLNNGWDIELWTGRPERTREITTEWFARHGIDISGVTMRMRADGDHRPDTEVKPEYLTACGRRPWIIFEDRAAVVRAFRAKGLTVYQVAEGNF